MSPPASAPQFTEDFQRNERGAIIRDSQFNIHTALSLIEVWLSHDIFSDRLLITEPEAAPRLLDDAAMTRLWLRIDTQFRFRPSKDFFFTVLSDAARQNPFHPVRDYLEGLTWDGKPRLSTWLSLYGGAENSEYASAVGTLVLIAAVRRAIRPGAKFDEMLVLEGQQGVGQKSSAIAALCPLPAWFSDDLPLNSDSKQVIERTAGRWIIEAAELSGMHRREVEHLKAFLSRTVDIARLSYDRVPSERSRHFIVIGTTNSDAYLRDATGNRRFWPVQVRAFDIEALARDRDQLWAEAAQLERTGVPIRLDPRLWPVAADHQEQRRVFDPWEEVISDRIGDAKGKIPAQEVWTLVGVERGHRTQEQNARLGAVMKKLGFDRTKLRQGKDGRSVWHYARGTKAERENVIEVLHATM